MTQAQLPSPSGPLAQPVVQHLTNLYGLPGDRLARLAARRSFVQMKQSFMRAVAALPGSAGDTLRRKVRHADDPVDLWRLRRAVLGALPENLPDCAAQRAEVQHHLDSLFPQGLRSSGFVGL